jgi:hypothetical protein
MGLRASTDALRPWVRVIFGFPRVKTNFSEVLVSSILGVNLTNAEDYGAFTCSVQNVSSFSFTLWRAGEGGTWEWRVGGTQGPDVEGQ